MFGLQKKNIWQTSSIVHRERKSKNKSELEYEEEELRKWLEKIFSSPPPINLHGKSEKWKNKSAVLSVHFFRFFSLFFYSIFGFFLFYLSSAPSDGCLLFPISISYPLGQHPEPRVFLSAEIKKWSPQIWAVISFLLFQKKCQLE